MLLSVRGVPQWRRLMSAAVSHPAASSDKHKLSELRKRTGFSFVLCKRALQQHDHDVTQAEQWLRAQAQAEGWSKMEKMSLRVTPQGLVCVAVKNNCAALVEVNCETDFVARTEVFGTLVRQAATSCLPMAEQLPEDAVTPMQLQLVHDEQGRSLPDLLALGVGQLGEKLSLGRAVAARASAGTRLATYVHPSGQPAALQAGRYGALVLFQVPEAGAGGMPPHKFGINLCQHIVGMAPLTLGDPQPPPDTDTLTDSVGPPGDSVDPPSDTIGPPGDTHGPPSDTVGPPSDTIDPASDFAADSDSSDSEMETVTPEKLETRLMDQEFLVAPDYTVREYLAEHNARVIEFVRMECGETRT